MKAKYFKASELAKQQDIPDIFQTNNHLIYSSPATLAYNSPGAQGFGVKRAGLSVPESVMLIVQDVILPIFLKLSRKLSKVLK